MSEQTYVAFAVAGTFAAVLLVGFTVVTVSRTRRSAHVLQSQLESAGIQAVHAGAGASFSERVIEPAITRFSSAAARITPAGLRRGISRRLVLAGSSGRWTAETLLAMQLALTLGLVVLGYFVGMTGDPHILGPFWIPLLAFVAYVAPMAALDRRARNRQEHIRRMLADTIDLLTISVEAGLAFDAALLHARRSMKGPTRCGICPIGPMSRSCEASCSLWCKPTSSGSAWRTCCAPSRRSYGPNDASAPRSAR
jgi:Flp pilus assembly protein TadB